MRLWGLAACRLISGASGSSPFSVCGAPVRPTPQRRASHTRPAPPAASGRMAGAGAAPPPVAGALAGSEDRYDGLIIDPERLPRSVEDFTAALDASLPAWRERGYRGIWLKVPAQHAHFVGHAVDRGWQFHHAEPDYVMLTLWLPDTENKLPPNASHQVGVGAFILNERREVLVVQEKLGPLRGQAVWKMPTGLVQQGEDVTEAAEREVLEETGVRARFDGVIAMRQAHGFAHGKSDLFFCCALKLEPGPQELRIQEDELDAAAWIPLEEFLATDFVRQRPLLRQLYAACQAYADGHYKGLHGRKLSSGSSARSDLLFFGEEAQAAGGGGGGAAEEDVWLGLDAGGPEQGSA